MPVSASPGTIGVEEDLARPGPTARSTRSPDLAELLRRRCGRRAVRLLDAGGHLVLQAGDADLEELVEVLAEDGQELDPLEQRHAWSSAASASTRALKSSQDSSRLMKRSGDSRSSSIGQAVDRSGDAQLDRRVGSGRGVGSADMAEPTGGARGPGAKSGDDGDAQPSSSGRPRSQTRMRFSRSASRTTRSRLRRNCGSCGGQQQQAGEHPGPELVDQAADLGLTLHVPVRGHRAEVDHADVAPGRLVGLGLGHRHGRWSTFSTWGRDVPAGRRA